MKNRINNQVATLAALFMCGMISLHGGISLLYLIMISEASTSQEILLLYLSGCLGVVLIPLVGKSCERMVFAALGQTRCKALLRACGSKAVTVCL